MDTNEPDLENEHSGIQPENEPELEHESENGPDFDTVDPEPNFEAEYDSESAHIYGELEIGEHLSNEDRSVICYEGVIRTDSESANLTDYERLLMQVIHPGFVEFFMRLLEESPEGIRIWIQLNMRFERKNVEGETEVMYVPFRMSTMSMDYRNRVDIGNVLKSSLENIVERIINLLHSGSSWIFKKLENFSLNVTRNPERDFNAIGALNINRLYEKNASKHLNSRMRSPLREHHGGLCSNMNDCFIIAIGISALGMKRDDLTKISRMPADKFHETRCTIISAAHQFYDCRSLIKFPVTFSEIRQFIADNEDRTCINIYGFQKKIQRDRYHFFPFLIGRNNLTACHVINLLITHKEDKGELSSEYHVSYIFDFHALISNEFYRKRFHCFICLFSAPSLHEMESHMAACAMDKPRMIFPDRRERMHFYAGRKKAPISALITWDLETMASESNVSFGPLTSSSKKLVPISLGYMSKFILHPEAYPLILPKVVIGNDCVDHFIALLRFESFAVQSLIRQNDQPLPKLSMDQLKSVKAAQICANCKKYLLPSDKVVHHCHEQG